MLKLTGGGIQLEGTGGCEGAGNSVKFWSSAGNADMVVRVRSNLVATPVPDRQMRFTNDEPLALGLSAVLAPSASSAMDGMNAATVPANAPVLPPFFGGFGLPPFSLGFGAAGCALGSGSFFFGGGLTTSPWSRRS